MARGERLPDYSVTGDGDITVYLLHGAYGSKDYWRYEIAELVRAGYRVIAWDAPGYGLSPLPDLPAGGYNIDYLARSFGQLLKATGGHTNVVLGHSLGGIIAPRAALLFPDLVHGLIVSATVGSFATRSAEDQKNYVAERLAPLDQGKTLAESAMPVIKSMFGPKASGPMVDLVTQVAGSTEADTFRSSILAIMAYDGRDTLKQLRLPTLLIAGECDGVGRPEGMRGAAALVPDSEFAVVSGAGHYGWAENQGEFNSAVFDFIQRRVAKAKESAHA
ncbi:MULTISPECIES: alpha/beta hydrolase [unclassified Beijerinckia]|uniref:alpha/beta fold hydrolase n=1 Tax=unclassified Beijerinckia TaxID=2638183 RepID=UPI00089D80BF|nr:MULTISPECIES: alpha/beta hydrolase [unclassified Beijerinckia]MDH7794651.1 3-oxoadipate enol-lactonase [Beijerinckia sp. GAS462]SEB69926.1 Pimeloyl-ACP methyl ester carboxylesterase [Beijerinckia sp. 28-YEA-48]